MAMAMVENGMGNLGLKIVGLEVCRAWDGWRGSVFEIYRGIGNTCRACDQSEIMGRRWISGRVGVYLVGSN